MVEPLEAMGESGLADLPYRIAEHLARALHAGSGSVEDLVGAICVQAVRAVPDATHAGVIIASGRRHLTTVATTGEVPTRLDALQQDTGDGPCLTAATEQTVVRVPDTAAETRWPGYAREAHRLGVGSMLCLPLEAGDRLLGTLTLYAPQAHAFAQQDAPGSAAALLAALASVTLAQTQLVEQLREALVNRDLIGQAKGIVMTRYGLDADKAFALIRRYSQDHNVKLAQLAADLCARGDFPA
jgi:GAF domain-containing protein